MKDINVKNKIIIATINSIEMYGIEGCTIRNIAKEANVNLSSVHYYFESKDVLVTTALNQAISGSFADIDDIHNKWGSDYRAALEEILFYLFQGAVRYPGITRAGLQPLLMQGKTDGLFITKLNTFLDSFSREISEKLNMESQLVQLKLMRIFSVVLFLGISPDSYRDFSDMSFKDEATMASMIKSMITDSFPFN